MPHSHHVCTNCGFWQKRPAPPATCPVCEDPRHPLPPDRYEFLSADEAAVRLTTSWRETAPGVVLFSTAPQVGIGAMGYLLLHPEGNVAFEGTAWYDEAALAEVERLGGVRFLAASHMHVYGALWRLEERFGPELLFQVQDLRWTKAFRVTWPFDERVEPVAGIELLHTGGHTEGHTILHDRRSRALHVGDMIKYRLDEAQGRIERVACQKAYDMRIPLSHGEMRRYRELLGPLDVATVYTPWEVVPEGGLEAALDLLDHQLSSRQPTADFLPVRGQGASPAGGAGQVAAAQAAYRRLADVPGPELFEFPIDGLDRLGVPVWTVMTWQGGPSRGGLGYGATPEIARASAWGELVESVQPRRSFASRTILDASFAELTRRGVPAVDPLRLCLPVTTDYTPDRQLRWVEATRHPDGAPAWLPLEFAGQEPAEIGEGDWLVTPITNGLGAGETRERAVAHGLLELLQRDGNSVAYRALDRGVTVEPDSVADPAIRDLLGRFDREGVEVLVKLAATDLGMANLYVVGFDREPGRAPHPLSLGACGEAVHPDREVALGKALREFAAARARKAFYHGSFDLAARVAPQGYLDGVRTAGAGIEEGRAFAEMRAWAAMDHAAFLDLIRDPVLQTCSRVRLSSLPTVAPGTLADPAAVLATLTDRLAEEGLEILVVDFTAPGDHARVVKVVVLGLEVETMTYDRIGPRNLRRLLERGVDFAGLGPPPPGAHRIPMTEADAAGFDAPGWFSPEGARRALRGLYPLYREPGRHAVAVANERGGR